MMIGKMNGLSGFVSQTRPIFKTDPVDVLPFQKG
jgi:hypothetical protein